MQSRSGDTARRDISTYALDRADAFLKEAHSFNREKSVLSIPDNGTLHLESVIKILWEKWRIFREEKNTNTKS